MNLFLDIFSDYTVRMVALGCAVLGIASGVLGSFAVLQRRSLLGDALSHAALPGIAVAFLLTQQKTPIIIMLGAAASSWLAAWLILRLIRQLGIDSGTALAVILSVFFGAGIVLLTVIQKSPSSSKAGLDKVLFGQAAALVADQVVTMAVVAAGALLIVALLFKELKLQVFDPQYAESLGLPVSRLNALVSLLLVAAIVIGMNTVGVILMSAMLTAPAAAARQWTNSLGKMLWISALIGTLSGLTGALISLGSPNSPTGPLIVMVLAVAVVFSLLFGSARGLVWSRMRQRRQVAA